MIKNLKNIYEKKNRNVDDNQSSDRITTFYFIFQSICWPACGSIFICKFNCYFYCFFSHRKKIHKRIVLIDGKELAKLMIQHNVGVRSKEIYEVKKIDEDYFDE